MAGINEAQPLDDLLSKEFLANFQPSGIQAFTIDGKLMAMPYFLDPRALYYRKDLFEKAGLKAPETWDDVFAAAEKLNNPPDMNAFGLAFSRASDDMDYWWYAWLGANGADGNTKLWDENGKSRFNTPEGIAATQFLVDLAQKYKAVNPDYMTASRDADLQTLFYNSKLAMLETGSWYPDAAEEQRARPASRHRAHPGSEGRHEARDRVLARRDDDVQAEQASEGSREVPRMDVQQRKPAAVRQAARRHPGAHRRGQGSGLRGRRHGEVLRRTARDRRNAYETPYPATCSRSYREAENMVGKAVAGEITAEEAMKQAAEFADKTNGK